MVIKKLLKKVRPEKEEEEFIEIDTSAFRDEGKIRVRVENLRDFPDTPRIQKLLREGNVMFIKIKDLREKNLAELRKAVNRLKKTCMAMDGDIVSVDEEYLIVTPSFARVYR
jgi:SepF-like predicted cell division protein (DUF552 family)